MRTLAIAVGSVLTALAGTAFGWHTWDDRIFGPDRRAFNLTDSHECWNPRAGHYERVRPGEYQNDLDYGRCRLIGGYAYRDTYREVSREECWNPRAGHYEAVRPGEFQNDLDFRNCRMIREYPRYSYR